MLLAKLQTSSYSNASRIVTYPDNHLSSNLEDVMCSISDVMIRYSVHGDIISSY